MTESVREMLAREAEEAEAVADAEERGEVAPAPGQRARRQPAEASQVYSLRVPVNRIEQLRQLADEIGEAPTALMRRWVLERLAQELHERSSPAPVADVDVAAELLEAASLAGAEAARQVVASLLSGPVTHGRKSDVLPSGLLTGSFVRSSLLGRHLPGLDWAKLVSVTSCRHCRDRQEEPEPSVFPVSSDPLWASEAKSR
jgi:chemotaxis protein histidine kinase CheA